MPYLIKMTPLTWGKNTEKLELIFKKNLLNITVDLVVIIGKKKESTNKFLVDKSIKYIQ